METPALERRLHEVSMTILSFEGIHSVRYVHGKDSSFDFRSITAYGTTEAGLPVPGRCCNLWTDKTLGGNAVVEDWPEGTEVFDWWQADGLPTGKEFDALVASFEEWPYSPEECHTCQRFGSGACQGDYC